MNSRKEWLYRIEKLLKTKPDYIYTMLQSVDFEVYTINEHLTCDEAALRPFHPIRSRELWGEDWQYAWFRASVTVPEEAAGKRVGIMADFGSEATLFVNGSVSGAFDLQHDYGLLSRNASAGETYQFLAEAYAGHSGRRPQFGGAHICVLEEEIYQFFIDLECLYQVRNHIDSDSLRAAEIDQCLKKVAAEIDFGLQGADRNASVVRCRQFMKPLLDCENGSTSPLLYLMGQSHLDIAWLWPIEETKRKFARTMSNQLALMDEYADYRYVQSQPYLFQLAKELYPELYERIKRAVMQGRIIPEGGMWVEPDTNIPSGESLIRQAMHGKRFFKEEFDTDNQMLWLPDVFGYSGNLPQIMRGCGLNYFASVKMFQTYENIADPFPYNTFMWEGIDGTQVLTHLLDYGDYPVKINPSFLIKQWNERVQKDGIATRLVQFGHGDGGGGANRDDLEFLIRLDNLEGVPRTKHGSPIDYFEDQERRGLPEAKYVGELYYPAHRGTYTTQASLKRLNRKAEIGFHEAELWRTITILLQYREYPYARMDQLWKRLLQNQFHDILPGTSIRRVHEEARTDLRQINESIEKIVSETQSALADGDASATTFFNSLAWDRTEVVALPEGTEVGSYANLQHYEDKIYAEVDVPSMGWASRSFSREESTPRGENPLSVTETHLENEYVAIELNACGEIASIVDKETGTEWAAAPCNVMSMYRDNPSAFDAWEIDRRYRDSKVSLKAEANVSVTARGPLFANIRVERTLNQSVIIQNIRLRKGSRRVEFHTTVNWNEKNKLLKVDFHVDVHTSESLQEIQFGYVKRPNQSSRPHDADQFEVCQHKWAVLAESNRGFALINDCKYGLSVNDNLMSLTLLRSPTYPDETSDQGLHEFTYGFLVWNGSFFDSPVVRDAYEMNYPVQVQTKGSRIPRFSLLQASEPNIIVETVKLAEDQSGHMIVRLYECKGTLTRCRLVINLPLETAHETDMLENPKYALNQEDGKLSLSFRPFEVKTLRLKFK
ncbi:alpha-mannosidase [Paenibacillus sp. GCM10027626]|uniref:alpha-mannosidase n=1 Tax=Paenibacillus sp. GCM10027626 TaxID=3273411 RepID=UPI003644F2B4